MATVSAAQLRHALADLLGDNVLGTATSATTVTLTDNINLNDSTNYWVNAFLKVYSATLGSGQERRVTASSTVGVLTVATWTQPTGTILYELHRRFSAATYDRFRDMALRTRTRGKKLLLPKLDVSLTWITDQRDYTVPVGFVAIEDIEVQNVTGAPGTDDYTFIPRESWHLRKDGASTRTITFDTAFGQQENGFILRLRGWSEFTLPTADTDVYNLDPYPVAVRAAQYAALALAPRDPTGRWLQMAGEYQKQADGAEPLTDVMLPSSARLVEVS